MSWKFRLLNTAIMSITLSALMTIYITFINLGIVENFIQYWLKAWLYAARAAPCSSCAETHKKSVSKRIGTIPA